MGVSVLVGLAVALGVVVLCIYFIATYRSLLRLRNEVDKAWGNVDILLKQRNAEVPKLLGTCRGYMQEEQHTLQLLTDARAAFLKASTVAEKAEADKLVTSALDALFSVAEKYPDLKTNASFKQLRSRLTALAEKIAAERERFNSSANAFNLRLARIPANLVAAFAHLKPRPPFEGA